MDHFIQLSNFSKIVPYAQMFEQGVVVTILLSLFTVLIGFVLALVLALMRMSNVRPFRSLGLDKDGHLRDGGFLVALSKFNPLSFRIDASRATHQIVYLFITQDNAVENITVHRCLFLLCESFLAVMRKTLCRQKRSYRLMPKPLSGI